ncbi:MAG: thioesterase family protein [Oscillospiraceae bacterium]|nr:thioesterase family protein [Oscillospiraceae bacterium]
MIPIGLKGRADSLVTQENTATAACSGALPVFGTPFMIALMEQAAFSSLSPYLSEGESTVGTKLQISHLAATPIGMRIWAECTVTEVDRKRIVFAVSAYDESGIIGEGIHERFIVNSKKFLQKTEAKRGE